MEEPVTLCNYSPNTNTQTTFRWARTAMMRRECNIFSAVAGGGSGEKSDEFPLALSTECVSIV